ncbi:hypothetical protein [Winogradskya humida]|uniref:Uncharacterized protein n=1 Tax=Winogradskya humida TaxID=113566 RepID=A0ABQ4A6J4_9ACTN|nr:hypothetical protein [Actinoplanes humidus]GIE26477.1 hypothetical protein Ahu01nite_095790 [Actinoplanes humidus]
MIGLQVRSELGEIVTHGSSRGIPWSDALAQIDQARFPCLGGLLPYADTAFNERQVGRLLLEVADQSVRDMVGEETASEIEVLCRQVEQGSHLYLWFIGD